MRKIIPLSLALFLFSAVFATRIYAVCPVCVIAVGAGVGLSRWLKISDAITGLWIGGFIVAMIAWTIGWLDKKNIKFKGRKIITTLVYYAIIIIPLYYKGIIGSPANLFCGCDKLLFGIIVGSIVFLAGNIYYEYLKKKNNGHAYFPFQKVVMPVLPLVVLSLVFWVVVR